MSGGLFDRYPRLTIVLGHLGKVSYSIWRVITVSRNRRGDAGARKLGEYSARISISRRAVIHTPTLVSG
jgi:predicted TIM-barrel fold metal-dependent hydrolase